MKKGQEKGVRLDNEREQWYNERTILRKEDFFMKKISNIREKTKILGISALMALLCVSCSKEEVEMPSSNVEKPSVLGETPAPAPAVTPTVVSDKDRDLSVAKELVLSLIYQVMSLDVDVSGMQLHWKTDWKWGDYEVFLCYKTDEMTDPEAISVVEKLNVELIADYYTLMKEKEGNCEPEEWTFLVDSVNEMWPAHSDWGKQEDFVLALDKNNKGEYYIYSTVSQWATALGLSPVKDPTVDFTSWVEESELILRQYDAVLAYDLWSVVNSALMAAEMETVGAQIIWNTETGAYRVECEDPLLHSYLQNSLDANLHGNVGVAVSELFLKGEVVFQVAKDLNENPYTFCLNSFVAEALGMPTY